MARPVLLILLLLAGLWWLSRQSLRNARPTPSAPAGRQRMEAADAAQPIEQCAVCGVHAPRTGMVALPGGRYRCAEHADQAGRGGA
ncbi:PP0621 family protein [Ralstonia solanacearum]|uniref:PP0621 family protein n=1 Tax=Ralstonia solanacearum TaxID=305 RepID=UPI00078CC975|nr:PP0621 family protein [Ralstonia solanacearum]AMP36586.1 hypothetical protein LBM2029_03100 [Ralstonia solanacearum]AXV85384.1 hypothetical protein CJO78_03235 [Ralstonia solanacearum]AXW04895.1 hypothetical protein CJO82_03010 [Ralstonia solanacearum]AXW22642.1 hypothetical protein CJO86_03035 [Ralstonia solanacearum]AXW79586.1 hypothetical protein CJO98_03255 [Ralstonia solanacearum]